MLLSSCDKEDDPSSALPGKYQSATTIVATPIEMYTKDGLVKDALLVDKFLARERTTYFSRVDVPVDDGSSFSLTIGNNKQATLITTSPLDKITVQAEVVSQTSSYFTLADVDSISASFSAGPRSRCDLLREQVTLVLPEKNCGGLPFSTAYSQLCKYRPTRAIIIRDNKLYLPLFSWLIKTVAPPPNRGACFSAYSGVQNIFNPAMLAQLTTGDTLVVQVKEVALLKR